MSDKNEMNEIKKLSSGDLCGLCDRIESYGRGNRSVPKEKIINDIIDAYKYAAVIKVRSPYENEAEVQEDKEAISEDLETSAKKVSKIVELLAMDFFDYERSLNVPEHI